MLAVPSDGPRASPGHCIDDSPIPVEEDGRVWMVVSRTAGGQAGSLMVMAGGNSCTNYFILPLARFSFSPSSPLSPPPPPPPKLPSPVFSTLSLLSDAPLSPSSLPRRLRKFLSRSPYFSTRASSIYDTSGICSDLYRCLTRFFLSITLRSSWKLFLSCLSHGLAVLPCPVQRAGQSVPASAAIPRLREHALTLVISGSTLVLHADEHQERLGEAARKANG